MKKSRNYGQSSVLRRLGLVYVAMTSREAGVIECSQINLFYFYVLL